jgi:4-amino-4-deoxy-L-arabinose transferase-like glycosyltransferase
LDDAILDEDRGISALIGKPETLVCHRVYGRGQQGMRMPGMPKLAGALLTTRGIVAFWAVSGVAFVLMLWLVSPGRTLQDALAAELLQGHLAGGYELRNPPLYEWLLWTVQQILGPGPLSYLVLRYSLIAAIGILFYVALRRAIADRHLAAAFSLSLVLFFWFGWESHHSVSHSLALLAAALALWIASLAYAERRTARRALGLGLVIGIGLMAKWSFLLVVLSLGLGLAVVPATRRIYTDPRILLVPFGACLPMLPFALWLAHFDFGLVSARSVPQGQGVPLERALQGGLAFIAGIPLVFLPWILIVLAFAMRFPRQPSPPALSEAVAIRLALLTAALVLGLMALIFIGVTLFGVAPFGITHFAIHYLFPFCLFAALGLAGLVAARVNAERFASALALTSLIAACAIFIVKLASFFIVPPDSEATNLIPYAQLAEALTQRGLGSAQFVTLSPREAGNLTISMPRARALSLSARIEPPPPDTVKDRPCVLLWGGEYSVPPEAPPAEIRGARRFLKLLGVAAGADEAEEVLVDWDKPLIGAQRRSVWHLLRGSSVEAVCRRLAVTGLR